MVYYLIHAYNKAIDNERQTHLHPTYLTCFKMDGTQLMLQSGLYDALKFVNKKDALRWMGRAEAFFPMKEFRLVEVPSEIFGRVEPRFVVEGEYDVYCTFDATCESESGKVQFVMEFDEREREVIKRFIRVYNNNVPTWQNIDIKMNGEKVR